MGSISDHFSNLSDWLLTNAPTSSALQESLLSHLLRPLLPTPIRLGMGQIVDAKDRPVGPFDVVGCWEAFPPLGEGKATLFLIDGVVLCLHVRKKWSVEELKELGEVARQAKSLDRKSRTVLFCAAVSAEPLPYERVLNFLQSSAGAALDGILCLGQHVVIRNTLGWYGEVNQLPFVSERGSAEALKAFAFLLLHTTQAFLGQPFTLTDYQHF